MVFGAWSGASGFRLLLLFVVLYVVATAAAGLTSLVATPWQWLETVVGDASPFRINRIGVLMAVGTAHALAGILCAWLVLHGLLQWVAGRELARRGMCRACAYAIEDVGAGDDGFVVCPECGAAWEVGDAGEVYGVRKDVVE